MTDIDTLPRTRRAGGDPAAPSGYGPVAGKRWTEPKPRWLCWSEIIRDAAVKEETWRASSC
jgi:hypothetical protein